MTKVLIRYRSQTKGFGQFEHDIPKSFSDDKESIEYYIDTILLPKLPGNRELVEWERAR